MEISRNENLMGIDYLEVSEDQHRLFVHFIPKVSEKKAVPDGVTAANIKITGGVRIKEIRVKGVTYGPDKDTLTVEVADSNNHTSSVGDFSTYNLRLVNVSNIDPQLSSADFSFKVGCRSDFDCKSEKACRAVDLKGPHIDYLSKDYASFRRLMLDRLSSIMPDWKERNPADLGVAMVEVLAYFADYLSYYQDAVATEAYLGTARKRTSVRRHARLLDYPMHDGSSARVWIAICAGPDAEGRVLPGPYGGQPGTRFLTRVDAFLGKTELGVTEFEEAVSAGALVFETMHNIVLHQGLNEIKFYTWGEEECCLPEGATRAALINETLAGGEKKLHGLASDRVLIFEEVKGARSGIPEDADPSHRHAVRLTGVTFTSDPLFNEDIVEIQWSSEDALPFPLCISSISGGRMIPDISVARGNVVLADHGRTVEETLKAPIPCEHYRPRLGQGPITQQGHARDRLNLPVSDERNRPAAFDPRASAASAMRWEMKDVLPAIYLVEENSGMVWMPQRDLLSSDRFALDFVVEAEDDGSAVLRFGHDITGMQPSGPIKAVYRVGNGPQGNIGAEAIAHIFTPMKGIDYVRNLLPAQGGREPEPMDLVRIYAPQAFNIQERAVTEADYAAVAERHPEVQKAVATLRWTGSWHTMLLTVDRKGGLPVNQEFREELKTFIERYRLAGLDLEVNAPVFVPLEIALTVCVSPEYFRADVEKALLDAFSSHERTDGQRGFFHPDNFTFGQQVYLSRVIAHAMQVPGVLWIDADEARRNRFQRWGHVSRGEAAAGVIEMGDLEVVKLDNDHSQPENGLIKFRMEGGQ